METTIKENDGASQMRVIQVTEDVLNKYKKAYKKYGEYYRKLYEKEFKKGIFKYSLTNLYGRISTRLPKSITIISIKGGTGKTTLSLLLASMLSIVFECRVYQIDFNFVNNDLTRYIVPGAYGIIRRKGNSIHLYRDTRDISDFHTLREYLLDDSIKPDDVIYDTTIPNLSFIPIGGNSDMDKIVTETLKEAYEGKKSNYLRRIEEMLKKLEEERPIIIFDGGNIDHIKSMPLLISDVCICVIDVNRDPYDDLAYFVETIEKYNEKFRRPIGYGPIKAGVVLSQVLGKIISARKVLKFKKTWDDALNELLRKARLHGLVENIINGGMNFLGILLFDDYIKLCGLLDMRKTLSGEKEWTVEDPLLKEDAHRRDVVKSFLYWVFPKIVFNIL